MILEASRLDIRVEPGNVPTTQLLYGAEAFLRLEQEWTGLYGRSQSQNPFLTWAWVSTWVSHFCGERLRTVLVAADGRVIAIAPFHLNRYLIGPGLYANALQLLGPREVQHLFEIREILVEPGQFEVAMAAILSRVLDIAGWDWLELSAVGADIDLLKGVISRKEMGQLRPEAEPVTQMPIMALAPSWEEQRSRLKRNIKESIRHCYNSLRRDGHSHVFDRDAGAADEGSATARLVDLHRRRSQVSDGRWHRDHFADRSIRSFEIDVLRAMHAAGHARFAELSIDNEVVAARACLESNGSLYMYYSGFDPTWWKYSVMTLLVTEVIQDAIARGMSSVNFSPGLDDSKSRWGPELTPIQSFWLVQRNPAAWTKHRLLKIRKRIRQPLHRRLDRAIQLAEGLRPRRRWAVVPPAPDGADGSTDVQVPTSEP